MTRLSQLLVAGAIVMVAAHATQLRGPVFEPIQSLATLALHDDAAPPVDREYEYPTDFELDAPFTITLGPHESVLVPLAPIRSKLFGESDVNGDAAIGFELNACQGRVLTTIAMEDGSSHRFSSADYQCTTLTKMKATTPVDLCPIVHGDRDLAIHKDPTLVKGFVLRAFESAEVVVLLRSTRQRGAYNTAFFVDEDPFPAASFRQLNVSFSAASTQLSFDAAHTWQPGNNSGDAKATCPECEYTLYADMVPPRNSSDVLPQRPPPPYCVHRKASVKYTLPGLSNGTHQHLTLPNRFGDLFSTSGDYNFILVASIPAASNNGHPAMFTYVPSRVSVTAPTHYTSHVLMVLGVIAVIAFVSIAAIKAELPQRILRVAKKSDEPSPDDESVRLLAQVIAEQDAHDALADDDDLAADAGDEERKSESLLDVIRKTKAQETTPQSSPRQPAAVHIDGYHEIN